MFLLASHPSRGTIPVEDPETVTLQWWDDLKDSAGDLKGVDDLIAGYQSSHPNVKIERTSFAFGDLKTKIIQAAATGTMPDIVIIDNPDHQAMAAQGALAVTALVKNWKDKDQYFAGPWASTVYQGKNYGVPYKSNATALFYNEDLLKAAGIAAGVRRIPSGSQDSEANRKHSMLFVFDI